MTLIAVAMTVDAAEEVPSALAAAAREVEAGAALVEWRVDLLAETAEPLPALRRLVAESPAPCIVTIRAAAEGGGYRGGDDVRVSILEALAAEHPSPRYVDVELAAMERSANLRAKVRLAVTHPRQPRDLTTGLILSSHDMETRPPNLSARVAAMVAEPACAVVKVAWKARSLRDNLEAFELLMGRAKPMVALCMGEWGVPSRVLARKFGALFTFARPQGEPGTAPGQPTVEELRRRWRWDRLGPATRLFGVVGWPVGHSQSPRLHNAGFDAVGLDALYLPLPVEGSWESFKATVGALVDFAPLDLGGLSVTAPHKEHLVRWVREQGGAVDPVSAACGSANTLLVERGRAGAGAVGLRTVNTDAPAAAAALAEALRGAGGARGAAGAGSAEGAGNPGNAERATRRTDGPLHGRRVAIVGAGGAARAVAAGCAEAGAAVVVFNRTPERAEALSAQLHGCGAPERPWHVVAGRPGELGCGCFHALVNCTTVGMEGGPAPQELPWEADVPLQDLVVMDTVYRPRETPLVRFAASRGARVVDGQAMFLRQAELQFREFAGRAAPPGLFERVLSDPEGFP